MKVNTWLGVKNGSTYVNLIGIKEPIERTVDWKVQGSALYADLKGKLYPFTVYSLEQKGLLEYLDKIVRVEVSPLDSFSCKLNLYVTIPKQKQETEAPKAKEKPKQSNKSKGNKNEEKIKQIFGMLESLNPPQLGNSTNNSNSDTQKQTVKPKSSFDDKVERKYVVQKPFGDFMVFGGVGSTAVEVTDSLIAEITPNDMVKLPDKEVSIDKYNWVISAKLYEK
jgi:hypothetical protein